jgi:nucleoside 2-deoxyribosyltransferase
MKPRIYLAGAITNAPPEAIKNHEAVATELEKLGASVFLPHKHGKENAYARDISEIRKSDIVLANLNYPSTGMGIEMAYAVNHPRLVHLVAFRSSRYYIDNCFIEDFLIEYRVSHIWSDDSLSIARFVRSIWENMR